MSVLTDVAVITMGEDEAVAYVNGRLADAEPGRPGHRLCKTDLEQAGAGGSKVTSLVVYAACFNHLYFEEFEDAVRAAPWRWPASVVVYVDAEYAPTFAFSPARYGQWVPSAREPGGPRAAHEPAAEARDAGAEAGREVSMDYESPLIDGVTDPEEIRRRITGDMPPPIPVPPGGWTPENIGPEIQRLTEASRPIVLRVEPCDLTAEPKAYVLVQPGWGEKLKELAPRSEEYCNVCENFPCLGNHPAGEVEEALDVYWDWLMRYNVMSMREAVEAYARPPYSPLLNLFRGPSIAEQRAAEDRDRREWIEGIRRRLGLVAEVHRCRVWRCTWYCLRPYCGENGHHQLSRAEAVTEALAHARSFVPQPPEPEPVTLVDMAVFAALQYDVRAEQDALAAALPRRMAEVAEDLNGVFADWLPGGMRFEWATEGEQ